MSEYSHLMLVTVSDKSKLCAIVVVADNWFAELYPSV